LIFPACQNTFGLSRYFLLLSKNMPEKDSGATPLKKFIFSVFISLFIIVVGTILIVTGRVPIGFFGDEDRSITWGRVFAIIFSMLVLSIIASLIFSSTITITDKTVEAIFKITPVTAPVIVPTEKKEKKSPPPVLIKLPEGQRFQPTYQTGL